MGAGRPAPDAVVSALELTYLNGPDVERLALTDDEILDAVEAALAAQGRGETVLEPRVHLKPDPAVDGHFNVLRGAVGPLGLAGVKVVGDFHGNYRAGLPSEMGLLNLFDPGTGRPRSVSRRAANAARLSGRRECTRISSSPGSTCARSRTFQ